MEWRIAKYRKFLDNPISHNLELSWLWDHILLRANHSVSSFYLWQTKITVWAWEFVWSQKKMADWFWISLNKTHRFLKILEKEWFIETKWHSKYTVFKVLNRDTYQWDRKQIETKQKANRMPVETYKNDNNEENENKILSKDNKPKVYWDPKINSILDLIKMYNNWIIDWTVKEQRQYWKMLLWKLNKIDSVIEWKYESSAILEMILKIISKSSFHSHKIVWPKKIYYELAWLMQVCKQDMEKQPKNYILPWID